MIPAGQPLPGYQPYGAPPQGYAPQAPPPGYAPQSPAAGPPIGGAPPPAWTPPPSPGYPAQPAVVAAASPDARVAALEARCAELRHDVDSIALFARTLLTMLEEKQVVTPELFQETKRRLDLLDGKLDDK